MIDQLKEQRAAYEEQLKQKEHEVTAVRAGIAVLDAAIARAEAGCRAATALEKMCSD